MNIKIDTRFSYYGQAYTQALSEGMADVFKKGSTRIANDAKRRVRVDTGELRNTIRATVGRTQLPGRNIAYVFAGNRSDGIYWAHFVEYGTHKQQAYPFMRPSMDAGFNPLKDDARRKARAIVNESRRERAKIRRTKSG